MTTRVKKAPKPAPRTKGKSSRAVEVAGFYKNHLQQVMIPNKHQFEYKGISAYLDLVLSGKTNVAETNELVSFIQGWLWALAIFSIEEIDSHNKEEKDGGARLSVRDLREDEN